MIEGGVLFPELEGPNEGEIQQCDKKHSTIRAFIKDKFKMCYGIDCPWDGSEARALSEMLKRNPRWDVAQWQQMVENRFASVGVNGDRPRTWIRNITRWAAGPLDQYGKVQGVNGHGKPIYQEQREQCIRVLESMRRGRR
jgi:hypothetical protein